MSFWFGKLEIRLRLLLMLTIMKILFGFKPTQLYGNWLGHIRTDNFEDGKEELTLRSGMDEVNSALENEITERLAMAGIEVMEARIGYLAYAPEIASSMLKRQQAVAIVAARKKIVEGAVGMVEDALTQLAKDNIVDFDDDKKASMASNLMIVLCGDKEVTPVINTGSLH